MPDRWSANSKSARDSCLEMNPHATSAATPAKTSPTRCSTNSPTSGSLAIVAKMWLVKLYHAILNTVEIYSMAIHPYWWSPNELQVMAKPDMYVCGMSVGSYGLCPRLLPPQANAWYKGRLFAPVEAETSRPWPLPPLLRTHQSPIRSLNSQNLWPERRRTFCSERDF